MKPLFDTRVLFEAFQQGSPAADSGCRVVSVPFSSRHQGLLLDEDRAVQENATFRAPLLLPDRDGPFREVTVLFHGLNEGTETKLFPWAANLAARGMPALIFPSSFHLSRRPPSFLEVRGDAWSGRRQVEGNARTSPYNAVLSQRMAERPDRFLRGTLQTYREVVDLATALRDGSDPLLSQLFARDTRMHFLGYSIGGYLAKLALLRDQDGLFSESRALLFSTGAALAQVRPQTILILDVHAQETLYRFYDTEEGREGTHPVMLELDADPLERRWLSSMLYAGDALKDGLKALGKRVAGVANRADTVFPLEAVEENFEDLSFEVLDLGLHELPFNQGGTLGEQYTDREGRRLLITVVKSYSVGEEWRPPFSRFVEACEAHLRAR